MEGHPETGLLLALAEKAEGLGFEFDLGRQFADGAAAPRAAHPAGGRRRPRAKGRARHRRAAAGTAQPGAAGPPGGDARPALRGPADRGNRHRRRHAVDPPRLRGDRRAVRQAGYPHERGDAAVPGAVDRAAGRLDGIVDREAGHGRTDAAPTGGPPIWYGGFLPAGRARTGRLYDGWFPSQPKPEEYAGAPGRRAVSGARCRPRSCGDHGCDLPDPVDRRRCGARRRQDERLSRPVLRHAGRGHARPRALLRRNGEKTRPHGSRATPMPAPPTSCCASQATTSAISRSPRASGARWAGDNPWAVRRGRRAAGLPA